MKKHVLTAAVAAALFAVPTAAHAVTVATPAPATSSASPSTHRSAHTEASSAVRVVKPGQRVAGGHGWTVWLTPDGKHWADPTGFENFRSVVDGNIDMSTPGVTHQSEGDATGTFHSGVYHSARRPAARVVLTDHRGVRTRASMIELPGRPGWGAWYVFTGPAADGQYHDTTVTLYDRAGRVLAELPAM
ncbi:hypothetical protein ABT160_33975 [Streptomyces sp. NPDC001941]|uniref:hypothetical protein n=1 Tax=Streptomyces sp. NPDC001941 TaxID=3154659 RepID=UPI003327EF79